MITILTPTYNRAHTLPRLYHSLCALSVDVPFEWLVVDDGSQDQTCALLEQWQQEGRIVLRWVSQANAGKHVALNTGGALAQYPWTLIVDSDDALTVNALACVKTALADDAEVIGVVFRREGFDGQLLGRAFAEPDVVEWHPTEAGECIQGDLAYVFSTDGLRANPFPVLRGERFFPELYIWNRIGDSGRLRYFLRQAIYRCEYLPDGLTARFMQCLRANPHGLAIYYLDQRRRTRHWVNKLKYTIRYWQCRYYMRQKV